MATREYVREERTLDRRSTLNGELLGAYVVRAYSILSTDTVVFDAYVGEVAEAEQSMYAETFHSDRGRLALLTSRRPSAPVLALRAGSADRIRQVQEHYRLLKAEARDLIRAAFPELEIRFGADGLDGKGTCTLDEYHAKVRP